MDRTRIQYVNIELRVKKTLFSLSSNHYFSFVRVQITSSILQHPPFSSETESKELNHLCSS